MGGFSTYPGDGIGAATEPGVSAALRDLAAGVLSLNALGAHSQHSKGWAADARRRSAMGVAYGGPYNRAAVEVSSVRLNARCASSS